MSLVATLALTALGYQQQPEKPWEYHQLSPSGLRLKLPEKPKANEDKSEFTLNHQGLQLTVTVQDLKEGQPLDTQSRYLSTVGKYRKKYDGKVEGILNEAEVLAASRFGAERSIGFLLEVGGRPGAVVGWHTVQIQNKIYEILLEGERKFQPWVENILDSQQYVEPTTGEFPSGPVGGLPVHTYLGPAFLSFSGAPTERATTVAIQGTNIPVAAVAEEWLPERIDYSNPAQVNAAFTKQVSGTGIAINPEIAVEETEVEGQKVFQMNGTVFINQVKIACSGIAMVFPDRAVSIVVVYDPNDKEATATASKIVKNAKPIKTS